MVAPKGRRPGPAEPLLEPGDRLSRAEFERRYEQMPHVRKAELIEGIVYLPSPLRAEKHGIPHSHLGTWLGFYASETPGVACCDNSTVRLHQKKGAYRRNAVREYLAWITGEQRLFWWELRDEEYQEIALDADGFLKSRVFPGLWLDTRALLRGDMKAVLAALRHGVDSPEHQAFAAK